MVDRLTNKEVLFCYTLTAWAIIPWTQAALRGMAIARIEWVIRPRHNLYWMYAERDPVVQQIGHIQYWHMYLLVFSLLVFTICAVILIARPQFSKLPRYSLMYIGGWLAYFASLSLYPCCVIDY